MLVSLGYAVLTAFDGQDGIEQLIKHDATVDMVLVDHSMPRKDGVTATKEIRELEGTGVLSRRRPIIAVTAVVNSEAQAYFKAAGADDFLAKPLALDRLRDTLRIYAPRD
jgi:CheY-like chemotaxis protein